MKKLEQRVQALEKSTGLAEGQLLGSIDVPRGVRPLDALSCAAPGRWLLLVHEGDTLALGTVTRKGRRDVMHGVQA